MIRRIGTAVAGLALLLALAACSVNTDLGGTPIPNSRPDTRITGQPPTLLEAGFAVEFRWTGVDPDGSVVGYQWKISDNGVDGISPRDSLTVDPLTGAVLHPWHFTTLADSTFLVLADQGDFPPDGGFAPRSFRSHTIFVRAVDETGAVDPTPAMMSFTATTLVPVARASYPNLRPTGARLVPTTVNMGWEGTDPDFELQVPVRARFLWKEAVVNGTVIQAPSQYEALYAEILNFEDPEWSKWLPYAADADLRRVSFKDKEAGHYYLFAVQVQDTAGAVSVGLGYQQEVAHTRVIDGIFKPALTVSEPFLKSSTASEEAFEVAAGQPINLSWIASAATYNGRIASYRHGWDLVSVADENDPGWAVPPGLSEQNLFAEETSFASGVHTFTLVATDDSDQTRTITWTFTVVPFVAPESQLDILVMDQVVDENFQNWSDQEGQPRFAQRFRNAWWHFLADGVGGVNGIDWERDYRPDGVELHFSDVVGYKVVLCYARSNEGQATLARMRPDRSGDKFVWLAPYQERGGNLFLVGGSSMESFIEPLGNYMVPIIFDTREENLTVQGQTFVVGFGTRKNPDGTEVQRGPLQYPYATAGIAALDWTSPTNKSIYNRVNSVRMDRNVDCVGLKGLVLDEAFKASHNVAPGAFPDTIWTEPLIDWQDVRDASVDTLGLLHGTFSFRVDEFVDGKIVSRPTVITPQSCEDGPNGLCIEPMFRGIARFDFVREHKWGRGDLNWPDSEYTIKELDEGCGPLALTGYVDGGRSFARGSALTNGQTFGFFSYKMVPDKPSLKADVYWGFDPYRFDHIQSAKAVRWVLQYFGLTINQ